MASKAQMIDFISEKYTEKEGTPVSLAKLDSCKKADLEQFIEEKGEKENLEKWISEKN